MADDLTAKLRLAFDRHHIPHWFDSTPDLSGDRDAEIVAWLREKEPCISVVIDDACDGFETTGWRCVQTSVDHGLTPELATEVIRAFDPP